MEEGQLEAWGLLLGFVSSMSVAAACKLRIPDILARSVARDGLTLQELATTIVSDYAATHKDTNNGNVVNADVNKDFLHRLMRFLCRKGVFTLVHEVPEAEPRYALNRVSRWLLVPSTTTTTTTTMSCRSPPTLGPMSFLYASESCLSSWCHMADSILDSEGGSAFQRAHDGATLYEVLSRTDDPFSSRMASTFADALATETDIAISVFLEHYVEAGGGFGGAASLVDVGGSTGKAAALIASRCAPGLRVMNFDLPHVIKQAPLYEGVEHVVGDMFESVPSADVIFLKHVLHGWDDENCIKILKNCYKALPKGGKVVIVDAITKEDDETDGDHPYGEIRMVYDLFMMVIRASKDRTHVEWESLLRSSGFLRFNIINIPYRDYIIEAFPI